MKKVIRVDKARGFERGTESRCFDIPVVEIGKPDGMGDTEGEEVKVLSTIALEALPWIDPLLEDLGVRIATVDK